MLTKKNDNYKNLELSKTLKEAGLEIDLDGISEDIETFLKKDNDEEKNEQKEKRKKIKNRKTIFYDN